jgi:hypothetical protein
MLEFTNVFSLLLKISHRKQVISKIYDTHFHVVKDNSIGVRTGFFVSDLTLRMHNRCIGPSSSILWTTPVDVPQHINNLKNGSLIELLHFRERRVGLTLTDLGGEGEENFLSLTTTTSLSTHLLH